MLSMIWTAMKIGVVVLAILMISQVPIRGQKICDYTAEALDSRHKASISQKLTKASHWIAARFNFLQSDQGELSGVLKKNSR